MDFPSLNSDMPIVAKGMPGKNQNRMANSVDPHTMSHYEPFHQDLYCLQNAFDLVCRAKRVKVMVK